MKVYIYDCEVFKYDWLICFYDILEKKTIEIVNDQEKLVKFHKSNEKEIFVGFNSKHYDQWIFKGILCGFDPYKISKFIIEQGKNGYDFSTELNKVKLLNYDLKTKDESFRSLKYIEASFGIDIVESDVDFNINSKLTDEELLQVIEYCKYDVMSTYEIYKLKYDDLKVHLQLTKLAKGNNFNKTTAQLSSIILDAKTSVYFDEFDIMSDFPENIRVEKNRNVLDFYSNITTYKKSVPYKRTTTCKTKLEDVHLSLNIMGVEHKFGFGGLHGARKNYHCSNNGLMHIDVSSMYPSLMINYDLMSRSVRDRNKYSELRDLRLKYKYDNNPMEKSLKLFLNSTYGILKDSYNSAFDQRQANRVSVYGQLVILDLLEKLEEFDYMFELIQTNTDGIIINVYDDSNIGILKNVFDEWSNRVNLQLDFVKLSKIYQKDVNNYVILKENGDIKTKGAYVKHLSKMNYNVAVVNKAIVNYLVNDIPVEKTIDENNDIIDYQILCHNSSLFSGFFHNGQILRKKVLRVFASNYIYDETLYKLKNLNGIETKHKYPSTPNKVFIYNKNLSNLSNLPVNIDKLWYMNLAKSRLKDFGVSYVPTNI